NAEGVIQRRVQIFHHDRILDRRTGTFVRSLPVDEAFLDAAAEQQNRSGSGEMPVHAVVARLAHDVGNVDRLIADLFAHLAFGQRVAAEFARDDHERPIDQPAFLEVAKELRNRGRVALLYVMREVSALYLRVQIEYWAV